MSKTRKKSADAPVQPAAEVLAPEVIEPAAPAPGDLDALLATELHPDTLAAIEEVMEQAPESKLTRRVYAHTYGDDVASLMTRHSTKNSLVVGDYLARHRTRLDISTREDILFPFTLAGVPAPTDALIPLLIHEGEGDLAALLIWDLKHYREARISKALIFAFAAAHIADLERTERYADYPHEEAGAPLTVAES